MHCFAQILKGHNKYCNRWDTVFYAHQQYIRSSAFGSPGFLPPSVLFNENAGISPTFETSCNRLGTQRCGSKKKDHTEKLHTSIKEPPELTLHETSAVIYKVVTQGMEEKHSWSCAVPLQQRPHRTSLPTKHKLRATLSKTLTVSKKISIMRALFSSKLSPFFLD